MTSVITFLIVLLRVQYNLDVTLENRNLTSNHKC